jgi:hypothetical protein
VENDHAVFADGDGVLFTRNTLRKQLAFERFLEHRENDPAYSFRAHLRGIGGAIEE